MKMETENKVITGTCDYCGLPSVRIIVYPPAVRVSDLNNKDGDWQTEGRSFWGYLPGDRDRNMWDVLPDGFASHWEARSGVCWCCWDGAMWPSYRRMVVNLPPEMKWGGKNPWHKPRWESIGRECCDV